MPLKILLVDTDANRARALEEQLSQSGFAQILRVREGPDLAATVERVKPDLIIIDMALPDRDTREDIRSVSSAHPIVLFAGCDDPAFAEEAIAAGVCSYNLSGVAFQDVKPIMASAIALFRRYPQVEDELVAAKALLEERRLVAECAKCPRRCLSLWMSDLNSLPGCWTANRWPVFAGSSASRARAATRFEVGITTAVLRRWRAVRAGPIGEPRCFARHERESLTINTVRIGDGVRHVTALGADDSFQPRRGGEGHDS